MEDSYNDFIRNAQNSVESEYAKKLLANIGENTQQSNAFFGVENIDFRSIFHFPSWMRSAVLLLFVLLLANFLKDHFKSIAIYAAIRQTVLFMTCLCVLSPVYIELSTTQIYLKDLSLFLGVLIPTIGALTAAGGNLGSAQTISTLLPIFLSAIQIIIQTVLPAVTALFFGFAIIDAFSGEKNMQTLSCTTRNTLFGVLSICTVLFFTVLSFQNIAATNTDTVAARSFRVLVSNAVPIIGGSIGEALKLVGGGLVSVKNAVGTSAVVFLLAIYLPSLLTTWACKIALQILEFICAYFDLSEAGALFVHLKYAIDFSLACFSLVFTIGIVNIGIFMHTLPAVLS